MTTWLEFEKPVLELEQQIQELQERAPPSSGLDAGAELAELERKADELRREIYAKLTPLPARAAGPAPAAPVQRSTTSRPASPTGPSCTATATSPTTRRSWPGWRCSTGAR